MTNVKMPPAFKDLTKPYRYKVYYGGRGAGRTWTVARFLIIEALRNNITILCTREYQRSIRHSVYAVIASQIKMMGLEDYFIIHHNQIKSVNGSSFIFDGLKVNINEVKSTEGIDICWVEEAQNTSDESWEILIPTIRTEGSYFIITMNTGSKLDPTYSRFIDNPPPESVVKLVTYEDNPFIPDTLIKEMQYCRDNDYAKYEHIWLGKSREISDSVIFAGRFEVKSLKDLEFPKDAVRYYYGMDFGFSSDPTVLIEVAVCDNILYVTREKYQLHLEIDQLPKWIKELVSDQMITCDNSRPETVSYLDKRHIRVRSNKHMKVIDGVEYLKSYKIIVDPDCLNTIYEFNNYSNEVDKTTGKPTTNIKKGNDHCIDAIRYAIQDLIINDNRALKSSKYRLF